MLTVYKASAGSGKTFTLARDYISLLLTYKDKDGKKWFNLTTDSNGAYRLRGDNRHRHILAITFTRKATNEMKTRIIDELNALAHMPQPHEKDSNYAAYMMQRFNCPRNQLALAAKFALSQLLFDYQEFNVSTIDAFFQRVLHTFARELDRQSDYDVELDDELIMTMAVGAMLDHFNHDSQADSALEEWIYDYMNENIQEGTKTNFFNRSGAMLGSLVKQLTRITDEGFKSYHDDMEKYLGVNQEGKDQGRLKAFKQALAQARKDCLGRVQQIANAAINGPSPSFSLQEMKSRSAIIGLFEDYFLTGKLPPAKKISDYINDDMLKKYEESNCSPVFGKAIPQEHRTAFLEAYTQIVAEYTRYHDLGALYGRMGQLGLLQHTWGYLNSMRNDNNMLLLSDANDLVSRIISNDPTPFVYERMGVELCNFLIDEFQDTSHMQWENLRPLVENGLDSGDDSLVIGDEKQSIYRWRNSDASILEHKVADHFGKRCQLKGRGPCENTNYRTSGLIVRFNNSLFDFLAKDQQVNGYDNVVQSVSDKYRDTPGYVKIKFMKSEGKKDTQDGGDDQKISRKEKAMHEMAAEILRQHHSGNYDWRDIAILVRSNPDAQEVVNFLLEKYPNIRVASLEALKVANANSVQLIVNVLRLIDGGKSKRRSADKAAYLDSLQAMTVVTRCEYYIRTLGMDATQALQKAVADIDASPQDAEDAALGEIVSHQAASLPALIETIIAIHLPQEDRKNQFAYIAAFQDAVDAYCQNHDGSIHAFLQWWDAEGDKLNITGDASTDAVQVMTIHKAKGLEFGCVHMPFCDWPKYWPANKEPQLWVPVPKALGIKPEITPPAMHVQLAKHMESPKSCFHDVFTIEKDKTTVDTLNISYVAFTRAKQELMAWSKVEQSRISDWLMSACTHPGQDTATTMDISKYFLADENALQIGEPTQKQLDKDELAAKKAREEQLAHANDAIYDVCLRDDTTDYTRVESVLDNDEHIDDSSLSDHEDAATSPEDEKVKEEGIILHDIMSKIVNVRDLDHALKYAAIKYRLPEDTLQQYRDIVEDFLAQAGTDKQGWYVDFDNVHIEQTIFFPETGISKRPDRVVVRTDGIVDVIDYKFTTDRKHILDKHHVGQVQLYMGAIRDMGHQRVRGFLCYPRLGVTREIVDQTLDL